MQWRTVRDESFDAELKDADWWRYSGRSTASRSLYASGGVSVADGSLVLTSRQHGDGTWTGAGVGSRTDLVYGRWTVRARIEKGTGTTLVALLWPKDDSSPPELDFAEDNAGDRTMISWSAHAEGRKQVHRERDIDTTEYHEYSVEWTPGRVIFRVDGRSWGSVTGAHVPHEPMHLALQTEPWVDGTTWFHPIDKSTPPQVRMSVDSVRIEAWCPSRA